MRLTDLPELVGFFSYSRDDDEDSKGALSLLRDSIRRELRGQLGRSQADFQVFQDTAAIAHGELWEDKIRAAVTQSTFFIPIVTPTALRSRHCKFEFESFLAQEAELGRNDMVFPILYIRVPALEDEKLWRHDPVLKIIGSRQYLDWQRFRHLTSPSAEMREAIERFCTNIHRALDRSWESPEENRQREEAEANERDEQEKKRQE